MTRRLTRILLVAALAACDGAPAAPPSQPGAAAGAAPSLAGRITDPDGRPIAAARVTATPRPAASADATERAPQTATTSPDGAYAFAALAPGDWTLTADFQGALGAPLGVVRLPGVARFDPVLPYGPRIDVAVLDDETGDRVADAVVTGGGTGRTVFETRTGSDGRASILARWERQWVHSCRVRAPGRAEHWAEVSDAMFPLGEGETMQIVLALPPRRSGPSLTGTVTGPAGPVAGALVTVWPRFDDAWLAPVTATTDAAGAYAVAAVAEGTAAVRVVAPGLAQPAASRAETARAELWPACAPSECTVEIEAAAPVVHDVTLAAEVPPARADLAGRVVRMDGTGVAGAVVSAPDTVPPVTVIARTDGWFRLPGVALDEGQARVRAEATDYESATATLTAGTAGQVVELTVVKPVVEGRVVRSDGAPLEGARVAAVITGRLGSGDPEPGVPDAPRCSMAETRTDADGLYRIALPSRDGRLRVLAESPGRATEELDVEAPGDGARVTSDFTLAPAVSVSGRAVRAGTNEPAAGVWIAVGDGVPVSLGDEDADETPAVVTAVTDDDGAFRLEGLPSGRSVVVRVGGGAWAMATATIDVSSAAPVTVEAAPSATVAARLVFDDGVAARDVDVALYAAEPDGPPDDSALRPERPTGKDGRFVFRGLAPGTYWAWIESDDVAACAVGPIDTRTADAALTVRHAKSIRARITGPGGADATLDASSSAWLTHAGRRVRRYFRHSLAGDGTVELNGVADGRYDLHVVAHGYATRIVRDVAAGATGVTVELEPEQPIEGELLGADGSPLGGVRVSVRSADAPDRDPDWEERATRTETDGSFRVGGIGPGRWRLVIAEPDGYTGPRPPVDAIFEAGETDLTVRCVPQPPR